MYQELFKKRTGGGKEAMMAEIQAVRSVKIQEEKH